jgi:hypothetical protein
MIFVLLRRHIGSRIFAAVLACVVASTALISWYYIEQHKRSLLAQHRATLETAALAAEQLAACAGEASAHALRQRNDAEVIAGAMDETSSAVDQALAQTCPSASRNWWRSSSDEHCPYPASPYAMPPTVSTTVQTVHQGEVRNA